ncbi:hypothetical protein HIM_04165 [Hirsutella minnesotensis 3608]|uniref:Uncharacterized protein n=1 Tax=Hirsutella minnesotensis 3608 TaxID=1043627 RepID=A0A0F7ZLH8_9HYPO|nr:hypothetical protein HIM_04165 [Hirsutella minnesotensis 3608]
MRGPAKDRAVAREWCNGRVPSVGNLEICCAGCPRSVDDTLSLGGRIWRRRWKSCCCSGARRAETLMSGIFGWDSLEGARILAAYYPDGVSCPGPDAADAPRHRPSGRSLRASYNTLAGPTPVSSGARSSTGRAAENRQLAPAPARPPARQVSRHHLGAEQPGTERNGIVTAGPRGQWPPMDGGCEYEIGATAADTMS